MLRIWNAIFVMLRFLNFLVAEYVYKKEKNFAFILFANYLDTYAKESSEMLSV